MAAGDAASSRTVYAMVISLVVIGVALVVIAVIVYRRTRVDPPVLAPLERMGDRKWRKSDAEARRLQLDQARPLGVVPAAESEPEPQPEPEPKSELVVESELVAESQPELPPPEPDERIDDSVAGQ